jgi:hypothetical protein
MITIPVFKNMKIYFVFEFFLCCIDKYDQLKKYVSTFFNFSNDDNISSYGQQQMLNIQETFFKSKN